MPREGLVVPFFFSVFYINNSDTPVISIARINRIAWHLSLLVITSLVEEKGPSGEGNELRSWLVAIDGAASAAMGAGDVEVGKGIEVEVEVCNDLPSKWRGTALAFSARLGSCSRCPFIVPFTSATSS